MSYFFIRADFFGAKPETSVSSSANLRFSSSTSPDSGFLAWCAVPLPALASGSGAASPD